MDSHQIKQHLTDLVLDGREEVAIEELLAMSNSRNKEIRNNIAALSTRYQRFEREKTRGSFNKDHIHTTSGRISQALMAIIEQVTEEDDSHLQKVDLEVLFKDIDALSEGVTAPLKGKQQKSRSSKVFTIVLPVFVVVIATIFVVSGKFNNDSGSGGTALSAWVGEWHHQMQAAGEGKITGVLSFAVADNVLIGKAKNVFPDGSETTNTLSQIRFLNDGETLEGVWKADDIQSLHGTFKFSLDGGNRFDGNYTVVNQKGEFYWNGTK